jgi:Tfp pilus assembly protein PilW
MKASKGFTLVELMISMGVTMVLMGAVYMSVNATQRNSSAIEGKVTAQQDVKPALDLMAMEIGMASYNPNAKKGNWLLASGCSTVSPNQDFPNQPPNPFNYRGIQEAWRWISMQTAQMTTIRSACAIIREIPTRTR